MSKDGQYFPRLRNSEDCDWAKGRKQNRKSEILHCRLGKKVPCVGPSGPCTKQEYFYSLLQRMLVHHMVTPPPPASIYSSGWRGTVRVK